ncbi:MAG: CotH kinase family protein [Ignavibacteriales bacterium]|nr:MAG: CotH kinase family protein [Ignavibacteriales bacterium]
MKKIFVLLSALFILTFDLFPQSVFINEVMSSNASTIADEDGDYPDWFEIYNNQSTPVDLNGYGISDDAGVPFKWIMPQVVIPPYEHLMIFASDKDRTEQVRHWETVVNWGDVWKYRLGVSEPPVEWKNPGYNDQSWSSGPSGFGYSDGDDSTVLPAVNSFYLRKIFNVQDISTIVAAVLHVDYDDAFVAYLNGIEIARANIGETGIPPAYSASADSATEAVIYQGGNPPAFSVQNVLSFLQQGENVLAIQVHNYGTSSSDLSCIPFFTLGMNTTPPNPNGTHPLLILPEKHLHTNFKLNADGDFLVLTNSSGITADTLQFGVIPTDISLGRKPDGSSTFVMFADPTPGDSNTTAGYNGVSSSPVFSQAAGFYASPVSVTLTPGVQGESIYYTLDGSMPDENSTLYLNPIQITSTKVLRATEIGSGLLPGNTITNTYFINVPSDLTVVSLSTNPEHFFDEEFGIYTLGDSAEPDFPYFGANFWKDWEKPIHVELFETNGSLAFSIDAGVKIFGGWSRGHAQKSLAIFARNEYGPGSIDYQFFPELPITEFESFVLRNSGNDWQSTMFRDGLITGLVDNLGIDKQAFRPAIVFINGQYWGIHNIREKVNEDFLASHHGVDPDSVDILEYGGDIVEGDNEHYIALLEYLESNSPSIQQNYEYVKTQMDVENYIKYMATQIYAANKDWPGSNIKFWRPRTANGKWRWIMFDTDFGFGLYDQTAYSFNMLTFATATNGPSWPNPPWSTFLFRKLLENTGFKNDFINCFSDLSNTVFKATVVVDKINTMKSAIESEIPRHHSRWNEMGDWSSEVQRMITFANNRLSYSRLHFTQNFNAGSVNLLSLSGVDTSMGKVRINSIETNSPVWTGYYFANVPVKVIAKPKPGFRFVRWEGSVSSISDTLSISVTEWVSLTPVFELNTASLPDIVINEINYNSSVAFNTEDWIELYNNTDSTVNLSNWIFKDEEDIHNFVIPSGTVLNAGEYFVLVYDTALFKPLFPNVTNYIGNIGFGLSGGGEKLRLLDNNLNLIDSLTYDDQEPWPAQADGDGPTLSLRNPSLDNSLPGSWDASVGHGTPGAVNDNFTSVEDENEIIPPEFSLEQNYPNPFNPATRIRYAVADAYYASPVPVTLRVYDILGNEIAVLVNEEQSPGVYEVVFDTAEFGLSSGVYFYQFKAGNFSATKKLLLLK